jgi:hypothetical protein
LVIEQESAGKRRSVFLGGASWGLAIRRAELKSLAQQYSPPAALLADDAADQAMNAAPEYLGLSSH